MNRNKGMELLIRDISRVIYDEIDNSVQHKYTKICEIIARAKVGNYDTDI